MQVSYEKEARVAIEAVRLAGRFCDSFRRFSTVETAVKTDRSAVTCADFGSQIVALSTLRDGFPDDPIVAEETSSDVPHSFLPQLIQQLGVHGIAVSESQAIEALDHGKHVPSQNRFWALDPIDGTLGFIADCHYAVGLALVINGRPVVTAIACPKLLTRFSPNGALFTAVKGRGAFLQDLWSESPVVPIRVSETVKTSETRWCTRVGVTPEIVEKISGFLGTRARHRELHSQTKYCLVAMGQADFYLRVSPKSSGKTWDHAPGMLLVDEAGGRVTDFGGEEYKFSREKLVNEGIGILASNGYIHQELLRAAQSL